MTEKEKIMKRTHFNVIAGFLFAAVLFTGCGDSFFERAPQGEIVQGNFYQSEQDLFMATGSFYNLSWFDINDKAFIEIGDGAGGNMFTWDDERARFANFNVGSDHPRMNEMWRGLYIVINQANTHITNIEEGASDAINQVVIDHRIAEARFFRAVAYFYLARLWGDVPIITRTDQLVADPMVRRNFVEDVFQFIINDLQFAEEHLVVNDPPGRATTWSAKSYLAKVYLTMAYHLGNGGTLVQEHLDQAQMYAEDVIMNSPHSLMPDFGDLFLRENNNNTESIFALQWVVGSGEWGAQNSVQAYYAAEPAITGVGDGWGGGTMVSPYTFNLLGGTDTDDARRKETFMVRGDHYPQIRSTDGGYTYEGAAAPFKKYIVGRPEDNDGQVDFMSIDLNTYMIRLAEVYLIYAEAILGNNATTSDVRALEYFNAVRERADVSPLSSISFMDILEERVREFTFEGIIWYDLVRFFHWRPQEAISHINNQERDTYPEWNEDQGEYEFLSLGSAVTVTEADFYYPIPEADRTANPNLMDDPVPFEFN